MHFSPLIHLPIILLSATLLLLIPANFLLSSATPSTTLKVFVIGLSKTGTTSLGDALAVLNLRRSGWHDYTSRLLTRAWHADNLQPLLEHTKYYDAFEDLPWALVYREMAEHYPDAKFILTTRKNEGVWLRSAKKHTRGRKWMGHLWIYGAFEAEGNEDLYVDAYNGHTAAVKEFFAQPGQEGKLLEVVIDAPGISEERKWRELIEFLGMEEKIDEEGVRQLGEFPKSNQSQSWGNRDPLGLNKGIDRLMFWVEEGVYKVIDWLGYITAALA